MARAKKAKLMRPTPILLRSVGTEGLFVVSISDERRGAVRKKGGIGALISL